MNKYKFFFKVITLEDIFFLTCKLFCENFHSLHFFKGRFGLIRNVLITLAHRITVFLKCTVLFIISISINKLKEVKRKLGTFQCSWICFLVCLLIYGKYGRTRTILFFVRNLIQLK